MGLNRSLAPEFIIPSEFSLNPPQKLVLNTGLPVYFFPTPGTEAFKLEVIGKSGRNSLPQEQVLVPSFTLQMLQEGTLEHSEQEFSELLDFHASEIHPISSFSHEGLGLLCTRKHLQNVIPLFISLFSLATFPEQNLEKRKSQRKLSLKMEREKTSSRSSQLFRKALFGETHPFGQEITDSHVDIITPELLRTYYENQLWQNCEIFISGDFNENQLQNICTLLEKIPSKPCIEQEKEFPLNTTLKIQEDREDAVQSSIRMGSWSVPKSHPDFQALSVANTILGGYFGSRLVKNIREDKGYTYGISSSLVEIGEFNYWVIGADVKKSFKSEVEVEIYKELSRMGTELIKEEELQIVRNYLIGQMLSRFSSSFDLMDRFRAVHYSGLDFSFYLQKMEFLKKFTASDILEVGEKYFSSPTLIEVSVG
jgi:zinc protease